MKNLILVIFSVLCVSYTTDAIAQSRVIEDGTDGAIIIDDARTDQATDIEVRNGALYINNIKISDLNEDTRLKIKQRNADGGSADATDMDGDMKFSVYNKAMLGVSVEDARPSVKIISVETGSSADKAGLRAGDIITAIDGENITDFTDLITIMAQHNVGDQIKIDYYRNKELNKLTTKLTRNTRMDRLESAPNVYPIQYQGIEELFDLPIEELFASNYETNLVPNLGLDLVENVNGLEVVAIDTAGMAAEAGIRLGDVIKMVQGRKVMSLSKFKTELETDTQEAQLAFTVLQNGESNIINIDKPRVKRRGSF